MASKNREVLGKDDTIQAVIVADTFGDEFVPISNDIPLSLLPVLNRPLIDYTLEFLSLGGIEEVFLFCCSHTEAIKAHLSKSVQESVGWSITTKVNVIVSESCHSFGDCLRDLDSKGLLRGSFVLLGPGTISNIKLLPIIKKHNETANKDKGAAMTLIFQESGIGQIGRNPREDFLIATNRNNNRVLFHKKLGLSRERKIEFPLEIFLENSCVSLHHNLKDAHIAICSPSVLPLFQDNFDFQTKNDFVRGLLMNEEILESTVYCHIAKGDSYGGAVTSWRMYQALSRELSGKWIYPVLAPVSTNRTTKKGTVIARSATIKENAILTQSVIGEKVTIGSNARIEDSFILDNTKIGDNVIITHSIIGPNCVIKANSKITVGSVLGRNVIIESGKFIENSLIQSTEPEDSDKENQLGKQAFFIRTDEDEDEIDSALITKLTRLHISDAVQEESSDERDAFTDTDDEELSYTQSPIPDDTKLFFTEVIDSLTRGFEDELQCDNLILEINSSRYAYNVTLREVNFNVIKAILHMSLRLSAGPQYFSQFVRLLSYFSPILKNYIRNNDAMLDTLQAIEHVAISNENTSDKWTMFVLKWFYDKDYVNEDVILEWSQALEKSRFLSQVKPFTDWLQEAEEATSSEESD